MRFVGIQGEPGGCGPADRAPDRVWCFAVAGAMWGNDTERVEPSWLAAYDGPVAGPAVRGEGDEAERLVHAGPGRTAVVLPRRGAYRTQGLFLADPFPGRRDRVPL